MSTIQKIPVSIMILTKNEEKNIGDCLESVSWAKDIIVLDDMSVDKTQDIAQKYTHRVIQRQMDVEGRHRNFGYSLAQEEWVLSLDADERVSEALAQEIQKIVSDLQTHHNGFAIPRKNYLGSYWIRHGGWYPSGQLKLFRKNKFRYKEDEVHCFPQLEGSWGVLKGDIIHYSYKNFEDFLHKLNNQSTREAQKWIRTQRKVTLFVALWRTVDRFFRAFILKKGYKDGFIGFIVAIFASLYQIVSYAKYWEMKKNGSLSK